MKILFVCTGNICRSPMAEGYFNHVAKSGNLTGRLTASSAGLHAATGYPASENAVMAAAADGIDISSHASRPLTRALIEESDLILTMTRLHKEEIEARFPEFARKVFTVKEFGGLKGDIRDPIGFDLSTYEKVYREIKEAVESVFGKVEKR